MIDVGIAEEHAVASAAGLAFGGLHPVIAVYATFLNRAFDQVLMDVALHHAGVTFVLDRAGITGPDGASHNGQWDLAALQMVPGMRIAAPRDASRLREELAEALDVSDAPTALRYPKGAVAPDIPAMLRRDDGVDVLRQSAEREVLIVAVGAMASTALDVASRLDGQGIKTTVIDPRWVIPVAASVVDLAATHAVVMTLEDGVVTGGVGSRVQQRLCDAGVTTPVLVRGVPDEFLPHASREQLIEQVGLDAQSLTADVVAEVLRWRASTYAADVINQHQTDDDSSAAGI